MTSPDKSKKPQILRRMQRSLMANTTVVRMNRIATTSQVFLIILRTLNTSDLAFTYMLFKPNTLLDIVDHAESILKIEPWPKYIKMEGGPSWHGYGGVEMSIAGMRNAFLYFA